MNISQTDIPTTRREPRSRKHQEILDAIHATNGEHAVNIRDLDRGEIQKIRTALSNAVTRTSDEWLLRTRVSDDVLTCWIVKREAK